MSELSVYTGASEGKMQYTVEVETLPGKEYLVLKGYVELGGSTPDSYAEQERLLAERIRDGSIAHLRRAAGSETVFTLFCHTCVLDERTGGYICGNDTACENVNHAPGGAGFDVVCLNPSEYAVFDCIFAREMTKAQASQAIDDIYWGQWLPENPYESMIETGTGANTQGIACISMIEPYATDAEAYRMKVWFPIRRKAV